jgi:hypothetical protein
MLASRAGAPLNSLFVFEAAEEVADLHGAWWLI